MQQGVLITHKTLHQDLHDRGADSEDEQMAA
jgi:hypothetical protein